MVPISKTNDTAENISFDSEKAYNEESVSGHLPLSNSTPRGRGLVKTRTPHIDFGDYRI